MSFSDPLFHAAADHVCQTHADENGLEVVDSSGSIAYNRKRYFTGLRFSDYRCVFEDRSGEQIHLDEFDDELNRTWESRGLRFAGWIVAVGPAILVLAGAGALGLTRSD